MARCCNDFSRTELFRRATAEAGRGLPAIEAGMPLPAGTGLDRRSFLARTAGLDARRLRRRRAPAARVRGRDRRRHRSRAAESAPLRLPRRRRRLALDAFPERRPAVPQASPQARPGRRRRSAVRRGHRLRWHPSLTPLATLHGEGKVSVLPGVGYAGPDQSHFTSRHFWEVGATNDQLRTGWLGRYLDRVGSPDNPLQGLSLESRLQPALATARMPVASIDGPDRYQFWTRNVWGDVERRMLDAIGSLGRLADRRRRGARSRRRPLPARPRSCAGSCCRSHPRTTSPATRARLRTPRARTTSSHAAWRASRPCSAQAFPFGSWP